jgi:uncharacterized protein YidB (DUF937 family)
MGMFDDAVPGGSIAKPLLVALGALLVGKMMSGNDVATPAGMPQGSGTAPVGAQQGGLLGGLGGLLERLKQSGHADTASSWVGTGQNQPIQPKDLGSALGQTTISDLARSSGMTEQELLAQLSKVLPGVVDKLTPDGTVPSQSQIASVWNR